MTELEKKEIEWLERYSNGRKELKRKAQEQGSLPASLPSLYISFQNDKSKFA